MKLDSKINLSDQSELKPLSCEAKIDQTTCNNITHLITIMNNE